MIKKINIVSFFLLNNINIYCQLNCSQNGINITETVPKTDKAKFYEVASYTGDFLSNLSGGLKQGAAYLGIVNVKFGFETSNIGLWQDGEFYFSATYTHGATPSKSMLGDLQVASNIEAGTHLFIQEFWYKHKFTSTEISIGLQDLGVEFVTSNTASNFLNSSFGIPSLISENVPVPIFPLTNLGITLQINFSKNLSFKTALFDGLPKAFENNKYNLNWNINKNNGALIFSEIHYSYATNTLPFSLKLGTYYHSHLSEINSETGISETVFNYNYGFYLVADQTIWNNKNDSNVDIFTQLASSPGNINVQNFYFGFGVRFNGFIGKSYDNEIGFAFAHAGLNSPDLNDETVIELYYKALLYDNLFIQPDLQYIINPVGSGKTLHNVTAAFLRFGISI